MVIKATGFLYK